MAIISYIFPRSERGRAMGAWAAVNGAAHGLGPVIGGTLTQQFGWQAIFLLMGGLTTLSVVAIIVLVPDDRRHVVQRFDVVGAASMTLAMIALMLNLAQGARFGWTTTLSLALWAAFAGLMALFLITEARVQQPFVELGLFANPRYTATVWIIASQFFCLFGMQLLLPLFLVRVQGRPAGQAGLLIAPLSVTAALVAPLAGRLTDSAGCRRLCMSGMAGVALAGALALGWEATTPAWQIASTLVVLGLGMGFTQSPVVAAVSLTVPGDQAGVALGIFNMVRFVGASLGSTIFGVILEGARAGAGLASYRACFWTVIGVAATAVLVTLSVPLGEAKAA
jgi:MFS family permease